MFQLKPGKAIELNVENFGKLINEITRINSVNKELVDALELAKERIEVLTLKLYSNLDESYISLTIINEALKLTKGE